MIIFYNILHFSKYNKKYFSYNNYISYNRENFKNYYEEIYTFIKINKKIYTVRYNYPKGKNEKTIEKEVVASGW